MAKKFNVKLIVNKKNGQMNFSLPKKKLSKKDLFNLTKSKKIKISIEEFK